MQYTTKIWFHLVLAAAFFSTAQAQLLERPVKISSGGRIEIKNPYGRVEALTDPALADLPIGRVATVFLRATSKSRISPEDLKIISNPDELRVEVEPLDKSKRIDISISMPPKMRLNLETRDGEVRFAGDILSADVRTDTGTIAADVPTEGLRYQLLWTASKPRFLSDIELAKIKEKAAGKFEISGRVKNEDEASKQSDEPAAEADAASDIVEPPVAKGNGNHGGDDPKKKPDEKDKKRNRVSLNLTTARGIILLNIPPNEVTGDLRERPLTSAAKAIIRSGDSLLMEAIRRAAPKYYGDYTRTLPPIKFEPKFAERPNIEKVVEAIVKTASVSVSDTNNRALGDLTADDFEVLENNNRRDVISVRPSTAPFNLVLLLDVSGSVDNYVNFIRKAARSFVNTVDTQDRISIVTFNDDVKVLSKFTTNKNALSASLDTFDAGGSTAYYDALAYTLADTLRPLKGERTAVVILTDGDDNRSFLPFDSMLASIQESGALVYPLYVPSALVASSSAGSSQDGSIDSLRTRYLQGELTSKAKDEGERLAKVSGGVYYPISQLSQIQTAYEDIVRQLRTAYEIDYRSELGGIDGGVSPRLKIRAKRPNSYVQIRSVTRRPVQ